MSHPSPKKVLFIRLSSIGDILLTTPVVRSFANHFPETQIHFLVKPVFSDLLANNPYIHQLKLWKGNLRETMKELKVENYDFVFDLHNNQRTLLLKYLLGKPNSSFPKLNAKKLFFTLTGIDVLPEIHIVERYAKVVIPFGVKLDSGGLDMFLSRESEEYATDLLKDFPKKPVAIVLGANFETKRWPLEYFPELINSLEKPVVLFGGKMEKEDGEWIGTKISVPFLNLAGKCSLQESGAVLKRCEYVITHDTGLMHMAAAFKLKIFSIWGSTVPKFGMYPYQTESCIIENGKLRCRPCSKLGFDECPKGHFRCMTEIKPELVLNRILSGK